MKKAANELEGDVNDDEAEIAERRKTRVESAQVAKAPTISAEITSSWLRIFSEGVRKTRKYIGARLHLRILAFSPTNRPILL